MNMKKLRQKLIGIVFVSVAVVFLALVLFLYITLILYNKSQADGMTKIISLNNGTVPEFQEYEKEDFQNKIPYQIWLNEESKFRTRYFIVYFDESLETMNVNMEHVAAVSEETAYKMAEEALLADDDTGYIKEYRYRVVTGDMNLVIFLDCSENFNTNKVVLISVTLIAVLFTVLVTLIFAVYSKRVVKPFEENAQKQRQFITDASHELKTPLSIISANAEVLQFKNGSNDWTKNIISQTKRMNKLIGDLLMLSKIDEIGSEFILESVDFTKIVTETVEAFQEVINQKQVKLETDIADGLVLNGNMEQLKQLVSILVENAAKYVSENGLLRITVVRTGKYAVLKIYNTADLEPGFDCSRLFDRFYRPDSSRSSEKGGHGIGLSIASKITNQHSGTLSAKQVEDGICFTAAVSCNPK